jgi:hypothetical protein
MAGTPQDKRGRFTHDASQPAPEPAPDGPKRKRRPTQFKHFRVDAVLTDAQRSDYEKLLAKPNTTVKQLQAFLRDRGHNVCRSAVQRHRHSFHTELRRLKEVARMAQTFCELTRENGPSTIAEASHARFEMMLMQSLMNRPGVEGMPVAEWREMSRTLQGVVATRRSVEEMRQEYEDRARNAAAEVEAATDQGAAGKDVVARMRDILGV